MCGVMAGLTIASGLMSASAQHQQNKAQVAAYEAQADNANQNARIQEQKGSQIADQYAQQSEKLSDRQRLVRGQIAAEQGAAGVTGGSGLDILASSNEAYNNDQLNLLQNQKNATWSNYANVVNYQNQESTYRSAAKNTKRQGDMQIASTIAGTALSLYGMSGSKTGSSPQSTAGKTSFGSYASPWTFKTSSTYGSPWTFGIGGINSPYNNGYKNSNRGW